MKTEIRELHEALSKSFKIHIVTKIIEIVGGIGLVIQTLTGFGIGTNFFPKLGCKGIILTLLVCFFIIIIDYGIFYLKKYKNICLLS